MGGVTLCMHIQIRLPQDTSDEVDEDPTGTRTIWDRGWLSGAAQKVFCTDGTIVCISDFTVTKCELMMLTFATLDGQ